MKILNSKHLQYILRNCSQRRQNTIRDKINIRGERRVHCYYILLEKASHRKFCTSDNCFYCIVPVKMQGIARQSAIERNYYTGCPGENETDALLVFLNRELQGL